jgi:hypothetical protein
VKVGCDSWITVIELSVMKEARPLRDILDCYRLVCTFDLGGLSFLDQVS